MSLYTLGEARKSPELLRHIEANGDKSILALTMFERTGQERKSNDPDVLEWKVTDNSLIISKRSDIGQLPPNSRITPSGGIVPIYQTKDGRLFGDFNVRQLNPKISYPGGVNPALGKPKLPAPHYDKNGLYAVIDPFAQIKGSISDNTFAEFVSKLIILDPECSAIISDALWDFPSEVVNEFGYYFTHALSMASRILGRFPNIRPISLPAAEIVFNANKEFHLYWLDEEKPYVKTGIVNFEQGTPNVNIIKTIVTNLEKIPYDYKNLVSVHCESNDQGQTVDLVKIWLEMSEKLTFSKPYNSLAVFQSGKRINPDALSDDMIECKDNIKRSEKSIVTNGISLCPILGEYDSAAESGIKEIIPHPNPQNWLRAKIA